MFNNSANSLQQDPKNIQDLISNQLTTTKKSLKRKISQMKLLLRRTGPFFSFFSSDYVLQA